MVDVHIIPTPGQHEGVNQQLLRLNHPLIAPHLGEYYPFDILRARISGVSKGTHKYVSWVDPDDVILDASWVTNAVDVLDSDPNVSAVYCRWVATTDGVVLYTTPNIPWSHKVGAMCNPIAHTFTIMRRSHVERVLGYAASFNVQIPTKIDAAVIESQRYFGKMVMCPTIGYEWKVHSAGAHNRTNPTNARNIIRSIVTGNFINYIHK